MDTINVMLVDDSAVVRQVLTQIINANSKMQVCAAAQDPIFAERHMKKKWPDVIILDVEMPRMDGITFLRKIMAERPTPVIMCSSLAEKGAETTLQALSLGAIDIVTKPKLGVKGFLGDSAQQITTAILAAAQARVAKPQAEISRSLKSTLAMTWMTASVRRPRPSSTTSSVAP